MRTARNCRRHKTKSFVFLKFSILLASKTYRFVRTWTIYNWEAGHHSSSHSFVAERVRGRTGRNTGWTTLTNRRRAGPPVFRQLYSHACRRGPSLPLGDSSMTFLTCNTEKKYLFWAKEPACAPCQPPAAIPSRHPPNSATSSRSSSTSTKLKN